MAEVADILHHYYKHLQEQHQDWHPGEDECEGEAMTGTKIDKNGSGLALFDKLTGG